MSKNSAMKAHEFAVACKVSLQCVGTIKQKMELGELIFPMKCHCESIRKTVLWQDNAEYVGFRGPQEHNKRPNNDE
jgi:hypothetical protein